LYQGIFPLLFIISTIVALRAAQTGLVNVQSVIASSTFPPARLSYVKGSENKSHMIITSISPKKQTGLVNVQSVIASSTFPPARLSYIKGSENKSHMIITSISPKKQRSIKTIFDTYSTTIFTPVVSVQPI
jgi:hypothetical protein